MKKPHARRFVEEHKECEGEDTCLLGTEWQYNPEAYGTTWKKDKQPKDKEPKDKRPTESQGRRDNAENQEPETIPEEQDIEESVETEFETGVETELNEGSLGL